MKEKIIAVSGHLGYVDQYLEEVNQPFRDFYLENREWFEKERAPRHPGIQGQPGGRVIHTVQVIKKALELNQTQNRREVIECCLVHDVKGCEKLPLTPAQRDAIAATKGLPYDKWRPTPHFRFVVLILISDMWSAFVNEKNFGYPNTTEKSNNMEMKEELPIAWGCKKCNKFDWNDDKESLSSPEHIPYRGFDIGSCKNKMIPLYKKENE